MSPPEIEMAQGIDTAKFFGNPCKYLLKYVAIFLCSQGPSPKRTIVLRSVDTICVRLVQGGNYTTHRIPSDGEETGIETNSPDKNKARP